MRCAAIVKKLIAFALLAGIATLARATITATTTGSTYMGSSSVSSFTLNRPSVINVGDLLLVQIALNNNGQSGLTTITPPSGWTEAAAGYNAPYGSTGGTYLQQNIFYRVATAADTANGATTWSLSRSGTAAASMTAYHSSISGYSPSVGATTVFASTGPTVSGVTSQTLSATAGQLIVRFASETLSPYTMQSASSPALTTNVNSNSGSWSLFVGSRTYTSGASQTDLIKNTQILAGVFMAHGVLLSEAPGASTVDHFAFTYATQGLTCEPQTITIEACTDASCSSLASTSSSVTLSPSSGWVGGNTIAFTGSTTVQLQQTTPATIAFSVSSSSPSATNTNTCNGTASSSCSVQFVDAGFIFDVPNLTANKPSGAVTLRAVKNAGDATNSCVALFQNTTQSVNFWSTYNSPGTGTRAVELRAGSGSGTYTSISGSSASPTALNLNFDSNGQTTFEARYQDAGQMTLNTSYSGTGSYAGLTLAGSDVFVSAPVGLCVRAATVAAPTTYPTCTSNYSSCSVFAAAGNPFVLKIAGVAWESDTDTDLCTDNGDTPNYQQSSITLSSQVVAPIASPTPFDGSVYPATATISSNGAVTLTNATESEVGVFNFVATPPTYFGIVVPAATSAAVGRFIPDHFSVVTGSTLTNRATSCGTAPAFTYLGETLDLYFQLDALNAGNTTTQNYRDSFNSLSTFAQMNAVAIGGSPRTQLSVTAAGTMNLSWSDGRATVTTPVNVAKTTTPVGPYTGTAFGIAPVDNDGVSTSGFDLDTNAPADSINDHAQIGSITELRYGRLRLDSVSGPADTALAIPVTAEYWNGSDFVVNSADTGCTTIDSSTDAHIGSNYQGNLNSGETTLSGSGTITSGKTAAALQLSAPGSGNEGSVDVLLSTTSWPWLQYDWNSDGTLDSDVSATASFGAYRGSDRLIYWRETQ